MLNSLNHFSGPLMFHLYAMQKHLSEIMIQQKRSSRTCLSDFGTKGPGSISKTHLTVISSEQCITDASTGLNTGKSLKNMNVKLSGNKKGASKMFRNRFSIMSFSQPLSEYLNVFPNDAEKYSA